MFDTIINVLTSTELLVAIAAFAGGMLVNVGAKFIKYIDTHVKESEAKWDDQLWFSFKDAAKEALKERELELSEEKKAKAAAKSKKKA